MTGGLKRIVDESMEEEGCRGTVRRETVEETKVREWEKERARGRQAGRKGENVE